MNLHNKSKLFDTLIIALTIHIFSVHAKLLYHLNPEVAEKSGFSFIDLNEQTILAMVFALAYSLATLSVLKGVSNRIIIVVFAILDALAVLLYYNINIQISNSAYYYALYTAVLIYSSLYFNNPEYVTDQILEMKEKGVSQREIARMLNISESKVSRSLKRMKEAKEVYPVKAA
jgi:hypothetical protein